MRAPEHAVAVYDSGAGLAGLVVPYARRALGEGEVVVAAVPDRVAAVLRAALGADAARVRWGLPGVDNGHLGRMFDGLRTYFAEQSSARARVRLIAEGDVGHSRGRADAYLRLEAAANDVHGAYGLPWLCLYDRTRYPAGVIDRVEAVHPLVLDGGDGATTPSGSYAGADAYLDAHPGPLSVVPAAVVLDLTLLRSVELPRARGAVVGAARAAGMRQTGLDDVAVAVTEVVTNALQHGAAPCRVRLWPIGGDVLAVRVDDRGAGGRLPVRGFRPCRLGVGGAGVGMWVTRRLADVVHVEAGASGASVELHFLIG